MDKNEILLKEYESLRSEILERSKREEQSITWSLVLVSAFFSIKLFNENFNALIDLLPLFMFVFGIKWIENSFHIFKIGQYIKNNIERKITEINNSELIGWETYNVKTSERKNNNEFFVYPIVYFAGIIIICLIIQFYNICCSTDIKLFDIVILFIGLLLEITLIISWKKSLNKKKKILEVV